MADRTPEVIRAEIASEQAALRQDVDALKRTLRARVPYVIASLVAFALASVGLLLGIKRIRKGA